MQQRSGVLRRLGASVIRRLAIQLTVRAQARASRRVSPPADLVHGMAYMGIPIALGLARRNRAGAVYDARDIYLDAGNLARLSGPMRWLVARAERGWARRADRVITVNRPYAEVMASRWGVDLPLIVMNCSYRYVPPSPRERRFHHALGLDPATRVVVYQGGFSRDRGIEQLIAAIRDVPGAVLVLLGYGALHAELERVVADAATGGRVRIMAAVPPTELLDWIASADVVAMPIQPTTLNHRLTTPNKLFEALAAGIPVVASDLPGMAADRPRDRLRPPRRPDRSDGHRRGPPRGARHAPGRDGGVARPLLGRRARDLQLGTPDGRTPGRVFPPHGAAVVSR